MENITILMFPFLIFFKKNTLIRMNESLHEILVTKIY